MKPTSKAARKEARDRFRGCLMKKAIISFILLTVTLFSFSSYAEAKSFEIERIHIKSWIQPNGDLLVNEVYTYQFDGEFSRLTREFPSIYDGKVENFYAYEIKELDAEPGFISGDSLRQLEVNFDEHMFKSSINKSNGRAAFLYAYTLKDVVLSYNNYSELKVTYFENGPSHDTDYQNVTIDFILPETVSPDNFDGFLFDRHALEVEKNEYGIRFHTPISKAYSTTKASFYFPSHVMKEMVKRNSGYSLNEILALEQEEWKNMKERLAAIEVLKNRIPYFSYGILLLAFLSFILLPQRHFWRRGAIEDVMTADVLYLYFVDKNGKAKTNSFLAGLFSLVERGFVKVSNAKPAFRFKGDEESPKETLEFDLLKKEASYFPYEQTMVDWLFRDKKRFNLHQAAGVGKKDKKTEASGFFHLQVRIFRTKKRDWEQEVFKALKEAGTFHNKIQLILLSIVVFLLMLITSYSFYLDLQSMIMIGFTIFISVIFIGTTLSKGKSYKELTLYSVIMFFIIAQIVDEELLNMLLGMLFSIVVLSVALPTYILSPSAVLVKDAIRSFKESLKNKQEVELGQHDDKWIVRAYLLKPSKQKIPVLSTNVPIATILLAEEDPISYVEKTWSWTNAPLSSSSSGGDSGGNYGSSGGSSGGGGGAGAD